MAVIDLRSDTVTQPGAAMRAAMAAAEVGDDVYGDDPTVNRLQDTLAERLGFDAGLFFASGTQSNLCALLAHCQRGDEVILGQQAHTYRYEGGGAAVFGSIQPQPLEHEPDGSLALERIEAAIKPADDHFARTRLLALENTISGRVLGTQYLRAATALAHSRGLEAHLDGARLFNAVVALGLVGQERPLLAGFDSVSVCLSKGLGAPVGSVLLGTRALIASARRWRKMAGGGMRQAGVLAAAGLYAVQHQLTRLADDHARAAALCSGLKKLGYPAENHTNMVFVSLDAAQRRHLAPICAAAGIRLSLAPQTRLVTHLDIDDAAIETTLTCFERVLEEKG